MEYTNNEIVSLEIFDATAENAEKRIVINIKYDNDAVEELVVSPEMYAAIKVKWLVDQPPFISDRYKNIMNNIILGCIHKNERCIGELNSYFAVGNEADVMAFFNYMRKRDLTEEKKKWRKVEA
jgi:hypothetical protein